VTDAKEPSASGGDTQRGEHASVRLGGRAYVSEAPFPGQAKPGGLINAIGAWLLEDKRSTETKQSHHVEKDPEQVGREQVHSWWRVMCLTGVDYFSTLGYQPGIAVLAVGALAPVATVILVIVTLACALPIYQKVAQESPHGEGSILMLRGLLSRWKGKAFILVLLGFAATDFIITITLSAADATAHLVENPILQPYLHGARVPVTLVLIAVLGGVFLMGFSEAIGVAVVIVIFYLALNAVVIAVATTAIIQEPLALVSWQDVLFRDFESPLNMILTSLLLFPKLALGLSGFETGVAVMPLVRGAKGDTWSNPVGRVANARRLLTSAALIMSVFLVFSSVVTTTLIPADEFQPGGKANGRALAYLAYKFLGPLFGSAYDISTIAILWFAGASAMAGLLNLIPNYLPRYGMAPQFISATRPLVLVITAIGLAVTILFDADVDAQGGAYATGVLVLMTSGAFAVTLKYYEEKRTTLFRYFVAVTLIFFYTLLMNVWERPDGLRIASFFIGMIMLTSILSRVYRSFELRTDLSMIAADDTAMAIIRESVRDGRISVMCDRPGERSYGHYREKLTKEQEAFNTPIGDDLIFLEVNISDFSEFQVAECTITGEIITGDETFRVLRVEGSSIPPTIAAVLMWIRNEVNRDSELKIIPHAYMSWTEGSPLWHAARFLFWGEGETATMTREILRQVEPNPLIRPHIHAG